MPFKTLDERKAAAGRGTESGVPVKNPAPMAVLHAPTSPPLFIVTHKSLALAAAEIRSPCYGEQALAAPPRADGEMGPCIRKGAGVRVTACWSPSSIGLNFKFPSFWEAEQQVNIFLNLQVPHGAGLAAPGAQGKAAHGQGVGAGARTNPVPLLPQVHAAPEELRPYRLLSGQEGKPLCAALTFFTLPLLNHHTSFGAGAGSGDPWPLGGGGSGPWGSPPCPGEGSRGRGESQFTQRFGLALCPPVVFRSGLRAGGPELSQGSALCCSDSSFLLLIGLMEERFGEDLKEEHGSAPVLSEARYLL